MATVQVQPVVRLSVADGSNSIGHFGLWVRATATAAQGQAALNQLRGLLPTGCAPRYGYIRYEVLELEPSAGAGDATHTGVLIFSTPDPDQFAIVELPGIRSDLVDPADTNRLLLTAPALQNYINALIAGIFCNPFGYQLVECIAGLYELRQ